MAWVTVTREQRALVRASGSPLSRAAHDHLLESSDFENPACWPGDLARDEEVSPVDLPVELAAGHDPRADRVLGARLQSFESRTATVTCSTAFGESWIAVAGKDPSVVNASCGALIARLGVGATVAALAVVTAIVWLVEYEAQHQWFRAEGAGGTVLLGGLAAAVLAGVSTLGVLVGRRGWSPVNTAAPIVAMAAAVGVSFHAARTAVPHAASARARLAHADRSGALLEAEAALLNPAETEAAQDLIDDVHMDDVIRAPSVEAMVRQVESPWYSRERAAEAAAHLETTIVREARAASERSDLERLQTLRPFVAAKAPSVLAETVRAITALELDGCAERRDWECVVTKSTEAQALGVAPERWQPSRDRSAEILRAEAHAALAAASAADPLHRSAPLAAAALHAARLEALGVHDPGLSVPAIEHRLEQAREAEGAAIERAARDAARHQAAVAQRHERDARRREERDRPRCAVTCCDGTCSPSCSTPHRGCCSHHGGVCG